MNLEYLGQGVTAPTGGILYQPTAAEVHQAATKAAGTEGLFESIISSLSSVSQSIIGAASAGAQQKRTLEHERQMAEAGFFTLPGGAINWPMIAAIGIPSTILVVMLTQRKRSK